MRWKNFAKILAQFTFEICGGVFFVCFGIVLFLKVLHMISALAKEKKKYLSWWTPFIPSKEMLQSQ